MSMESQRRTKHILLVEDSPTDALIVQQLLARNPDGPALHTVENGGEALAFLRREPPYPSAPRPDLILLDLNLPRRDRREVLADIKADPAFALIPIVVLTGSSSEQDVVHAYAHHANCYITKPNDFPQLAEALRALDHFWFDVVTLPPSAAPVRDGSEVEVSK